jgi:hypothetical protein
MPYVDKIYVTRKSINSRQMYWKEELGLVADSIQQGLSSEADNRSAGQEIPSSFHET